MSHYLTHSLVPHFPSVQAEQEEAGEEAGAPPPGEEGSEDEDEFIYNPVRAVSAACRCAKCVTDYAAAWQLESCRITKGAERLA